MRTTTRSDYLDRLRRVLRYIQEHLDDAQLTPEECARVAHYSRFHFHRLFSGLVGESLSEHIRRIRLERAAGDLRCTELSVLDIALGAGYDAHEPFTRAFRAHFGLPPVEFRKLTGPVQFPRALCGVHYGIDDVVSRFVPLTEESNMIDVKIGPLPARRLLARLHEGDYMQIGQAFGALSAVAGPLGLFGPYTQFVGMFYNDPDVTPVEERRSHAGMTVPASFGPAPEGFELLDVAGGEFAIGVHRGPYDQLPTSYKWLFSQWLPSNGREPANQPACEVYINDPSDTAPADLLTHIQIALMPVEAAVAKV